MLSGQSLIWNCASFSLGMSFHVAKNICRSAGEEEGVRDGTPINCGLSITCQEMGLVSNVPPEAE